MFRGALLPPTPTDFKRGHIEVAASPDGTSLEYRCIDREMPTRINLGPYADTTPLKLVTDVRVASLSGAQTVGGVALVAGDRVELTGQGNGASPNITQNGQWIVQAGPWTRPVGGTVHPYIANIEAYGNASYRRMGDAQANAAFVNSAVNNIISAGTNPLTGLSNLLTNTVQSAAERERATAPVFSRNVTFRVWGTKQSNSNILARVAVLLAINHLGPQDEDSSFSISLSYDIMSRFVEVSAGKHSGAEQLANNLLQTPQNRRGAHFLVQSFKSIDDMNASPISQIDGGTTDYKVRLIALNPGTSGDSPGPPNGSGTRGTYMGQLWAAGLSGAGDLPAAPPTQSQISGETVDLPLS